MNIGSLPHLVRRWWGMVRDGGPSVGDETWTSTILGDGEFALWSTMDRRDRQHSLIVARRLNDLAAREGLEIPRSAMAAALLHDVGKVESGLSIPERIAATLFGGRTARFRSYLDHERLGVDMCRKAGADPDTVDLLAGTGDPLIRDLLARADRI